MPPPHLFVIPIYICLKEAKIDFDTYLIELYPIFRIKG